MSNFTLKDHHSDQEINIKSGIQILLNLGRLEIAIRSRPRSELHLQPGRLQN